MIRLYTASKLHHADKWRRLCSATGHVQCHARWLKHTAMGTPDTADHAREFWLQDEQDVRDADVVLVYAEGDDHLRGALVEAGIAIASGIPVVVVGDHPDYGTWQHHPAVIRAVDLAHALRLLQAMEPRYRARWPREAQREGDRHEKPDRSAAARPRHRSRSRAS